MSNVIKIIKENDLNIPIGTILHFHGFFHKTKNDNPKLWDTISYYIWGDSLGNLHTIKERILYPQYKDCYINCICLNWKRKFLFEGDVYWKVFTNEKITNFHKLEFENGKHLPAKLFKPYKDIVYNNTNFMTSDCQRFETKQEALEYCNKKF